MSDGDGGSTYVTFSECRGNTEHIKDLLRGIEEDVARNRVANERIIKILQGNGEGGLIWKVNALLMRNQWVDRIFGALISVFLTLLTLYLSGVLHL